MSKNPINLAFRFFLELAGLFALGYWGWTQHEGILRVLLAIGVPLIGATLWGVFRVDNMPGKAPVRVPGWVRLLLELAYFGTATLLLFAANQPTGAAWFGALVVLHYLLSYDYVRVLLKTP